MECFTKANGLTCVLCTHPLRLSRLNIAVVLSFQTDFFTRDYFNTWFKNADCRRVAFKNSQKDRRTAYPRSFAHLGSELNIIRTFALIIIIYFTPFFFTHTYKQIYNSLAEQYRLDDKEPCQACELTLSHMICPL